MSTERKWWKRALGGVGIHAYGKGDTLPEYDRAAAEAGRYVFVWNDDVSPMKAVVKWLEESFELPSHTATRLMITIHNAGFAALGPYPDGEAQRRLEKAQQCAARLGLRELRFSRKPPPEAHDAKGL